MVSFFKKYLQMAKKLMKICSVSQIRKMCNREILPHTHYNSSCQNQKIANIGKDLEKMETLCTILGNVKTAAKQNSMVVLQKLKNRMII